MSKFSNVDLKSKHTKPFVSAFVIKRMVDDTPDISWLEDENNYKAGEKITFKGEEMDAREFAKHRLETYGSIWYMIGIRAECTVLLPEGQHYLMQTLHSGGLWGIESDSDDEYLKEIEEVELGQLKKHCKTLGIRFDKNTPVERKEE